MTHRKSRSQVGAWGKAPQGGTIQIQRKTKKGWRTVKRVQARKGAVFTSSLRQRGSATFRGKAGKVTSMPWHQGG